MSTSSGSPSAASHIFFAKIIADDPKSTGFVNNFLRHLGEKQGKVHQFDKQREGAVLYVTILYTLPQGAMVSSEYSRQ